MPMHAACKIRALYRGRDRDRRRGLRRAGAQGASRCRGRTRACAPAAVGQAYQVVGSESLLIVRVYRGGTLARAGHNHIVASHDLAGTVYVAKDLVALNL